MLVGVGGNIDFFTICQGIAVIKLLATNDSNESIGRKKGCSNDERKRDSACVCCERRRIGQIVGMVERTFSLSLSSHRVVYAKIRQSGMKPRGHRRENDLEWGCSLWITILNSQTRIGLMGA